MEEKTKGIVFCSAAMDTFCEYSHACINFEEKFWVKTKTTKRKIAKLHKNVKKKKK